MTMNQGYPNDSSDDTKQVAEREARNLADKAQHATEDVVGTARDEAGNVKDETVAQAKSLMDAATEEVSAQASTQKNRLAEQSRVVTDDLQRIARGEQPESDMVGTFVSSVAAKAEDFTTQLENKEPSDLLDDVRRFAARKPFLFLAIAGGLGLLAGRLTRGLKDAGSDSNGGSRDSARRGQIDRPDASPSEPVLPRPYDPESSRPERPRTEPSRTAPKPSSYEPPLPGSARPYPSEPERPAPAPGGRTEPPIGPYGAAAPLGQPSAPGTPPGGPLDRPGGPGLGGGGLA